MFEITSGIDDECAWGVCHASQSATSGVPGFLGEGACLEFAVASARVVDCGSRTSLCVNQAGAECAECEWVSEH